MAYLMWLDVVYTKTPFSSQVPDLTLFNDYNQFKFTTHEAKALAHLVFSWMEQRDSSFLLQMVMTCLDRRATVVMSGDQITYLRWNELLLHARKT